MGPKTFSLSFTFLACWAALSIHQETTFVVVAQDPTLQQQLGSTALFRQTFLVSGAEPEVLEDEDQMLFAWHMQGYLQGAVCNVEDQEILFDEETMASNGSNFTLQIDYQCFLPGGPALSIQYLDFVSRQNVTAGLSDRGLPILDTSPPIQIQAVIENPPTFAPVTAASVELSFFQQYFVLHPGSTGFTPVQEMIISLDLQTIAVEKVGPVLNNATGGTMDAACVIPRQGQQVTSTSEQAVAILSIQCSFSSNTVNVMEVPSALVDHVNGNLPTITTSLQQRGLAAIVRAEPLQIMEAPTIAPTGMPVPTSAVPTVAPTTMAPTAGPTGMPTTAGPTSLAPTTLAPTMEKTVTEVFVQRFGLEERRGGVVWDDDERSGVEEVWVAWADEVFKDEDKDITTTCDVTDQSILFNNFDSLVSDVDTLRVEYECTFSSPTENVTDAPGTFIAYVNEYVDEFARELEGGLRVEEAFPILLAGSPTAAPTPIPPSNRQVATYSQNFVMEESGMTMIGQGDPEEAFISYVQSLVEEFGDRRVTTVCDLENQLWSNATNETILSVDYSCTYSSLETNVSAYPDEYKEYVNENLDDFTNNLQRNVNDGILESRAVRSFEWTFEPTMAPTGTTSNNSSGADSKTPTATPTLAPAGSESATKEVSSAQAMAVWVSFALVALVWVM